MNIKKQCSKCGEEFPKTEEYFGKRKDSSDGFKCMCKICDKERGKKYRKEHSTKKILYREINGIIEKQCTKCGEWFPRTKEYFHKNKTSKDGLRTECKTCSREYDETHKEESKKYYNEHKEINKEYSKKYQEEHKEKYKEYSKKHREKNKKERVEYIKYREINGIVEKQCTKCGEWYQNTDEHFGKQNNNRDNLRTQCRICARLANKKYKEINKEKTKDRYAKYYEEHKEEILERGRISDAKRSEGRKQYKIDYNKKYKERDKAIHLESYNIKKYNLSNLQYNQMLKNQNNKCDICGEELKTGSGGRAIDHCHITSKVRAILCTKCNTTLGHFENKETFNSMIAYLELHKEN